MNLTIYPNVVCHRFFYCCCAIHSHNRVFNNEQNSYLNMSVQWFSLLLYINAWVSLSLLGVYNLILLMRGYQQENKTETSILLTFNVQPSVLLTFNLQTSILLTFTLQTSVLLMRYKIIVALRLSSSPVWYFSCENT